MIYFFEMPDGSIKVFFPHYFVTEMTQLPGTETQVPQEATAEEVGSKGVSGGCCLHAKVHSAHSRGHAGYGKISQSCTLKR